MIGQDGFAFHKRTRRPPLDPANSLLSFGYTLLFNEMQTMIRRHRLSPYVGYLHALRENHPALASDLIEEFRAPVVDRFALNAINLRMLVPEDFTRDGRSGAVYCTDDGRRKLIARWEEWMVERRALAGCSGTDFRRLMDRQVRRLVDVLLGDAEEYVPLLAREVEPCDS